MTSQYAGMTVNERLVVSGLMGSFEGAIMRKDFVKAKEVLESVGLGEENIRAILEQAAKESGDTNSSNL